ncbi:MAG: T9SS type A sorting domain-containing protein [candidate division KSB1 bacterium]|nr:T9SS type A sorting domain-containing protein [candidate division KSB1 bacterium]
MVSQRKFIGWASFLVLWVPSVWAQRIDDPLGDIPQGDPAYMDMKAVKFHQSLDRIYIDFYPNAVIPKGNQAGITTETIFEVYMDVDNDPTTGVSLEDIGYDYKLHVNLYLWNGKSWINGNVYWDFDTHGLPHSENGFFVFASNLISSRFRWEFSLVTLKWPRINWIARNFYENHWADQVPDAGHATLEIDTTVVADVDTVSGQYIMFIYPTTFQKVMDQYEIVKAVDAGAQIESQLCGTEFHDIQRIQFDPWLQGVNYCGNPVMMGSWSWGDEPAWFIYFHELGHNFTLASVRFQQLYPSGGYVSANGDDWHFGTNFMEAWATMVGLYAMRELFTNGTQYQLNSDCVQNLEQHFSNTKSSYQGALNIYEQTPDFSKLYPDVVDGIYLTLAETHGYGIFPKFFKILQPPDRPWHTLDEIKPDQDYDWAKTLSMTVTCCAFSVVAGADLRNQFKDQWDFPIYDPFYQQIKPEIEGLITSVAELPALTEMRLQLFPNYPNPFNAKTVISYRLPESSTVKVKIYNLLGQLVTILNEGVKPAGDHQLIWDAEGFPSGVYIYSVETNQGTEARKCTVLK